MGILCARFDPLSRVSGEDGLRCQRDLSLVSGSGPVLVTAEAPVSLYGGVVGALSGTWQQSRGSPAQPHRHTSTRCSAPRATSAVPPRSLGREIVAVAVFLSVSAPCLAPARPPSPTSLSPPTPLRRQHTPPAPPGSAPPYVLDHFSCRFCGRPPPAPVAGTDAWLCRALRAQTSAWCPKVEAAAVQAPRVADRVCEDLGTVLTVLPCLDRPSPVPI